MVDVNVSCTLNISGNGNIEKCAKQSDKYITQIETSGNVVKWVKVLKDTLITTEINTYIKKSIKAFSFNNIEVKALSGIKKHIAEFVSYFSTMGISGTPQKRAHINNSDNTGVNYILSVAKHIYNRISRFVTYTYLKSYNIKKKAITLLKRY